MKPIHPLRTCCDGTHALSFESGHHGVGQPGQTYGFGQPSQTRSVGQPGQTRGAGQPGQPGPVSGFGRTSIPAAGGISMAALYAHSLEDLPAVLTQMQTTSSVLLSAQDCLYAPGAAAAVPPVSRQQQPIWEALRRLHTQVVLGRGRALARTTPRAPVPSWLPPSSSGCIEGPLPRQWGSQATGVPHQGTKRSMKDVCPQQDEAEGVAASKRSRQEPEELAAIQPAASWVSLDPPSAAQQQQHKQEQSVTASKSIHAATTLPQTGRSQPPRPAFHAPVSQGPPAGPAGLHGIDGPKGPAAGHVVLPGLPGTGAQEGPAAGLARLDGTTAVEKPPAAPDGGPQAAGFAVSDQLKQVLSGLQPSRDQDWPALRAQVESIAQHPEAVMKLQGLGSCSELGVQLLCEELLADSCTYQAAHLVLAQTLLPHLLSLTQDAPPALVQACHTSAGNHGKALLEAVLQPLVRQPVLVKAQAKLVAKVAGESLPAVLRHELLAAILGRSLPGSRGLQWSEGHIELLQSMLDKRVEMQEEDLGLFVACVAASCPVMQKNVGLLKLVLTVVSIHGSKLSQALVSNLQVAVRSTRSFLTKQVLAKLDKIT